MWSSAKIRRDFPIFRERPDLVYLDSTATALKPLPVIEAMDGYYRTYSANVFRGLYPISEEATDRYEKARQTVAGFINTEAAEVVFVRNATEAINLVAYSLGRELLNENAEVVTSVVEHHANFVPWQQLAFENGAAFKVLEMDERGLIPLDKPDFAERVITKKTGIVALNYVSNVLGTINPVKKIVRNIRAINPNAVIVLDAAQAVPSLPVDVKDLGCDFVAFSGHKVLGPTGIGVLWGKREHLERMSPFLYGGEMIKEVTLSGSRFAESPHKFEAGTPHIAGAIGLAAALEYLSQFPFDRILEHERALWQAAWDGLKSNPNIVLLGPPEAANRTGILSFYHRRIHAHDLSQLLAADNVCIRAGHHCAMPLHTHLKADASARASFYVYNTVEDVDKFLSGLKKAEKLFG